MNHDPATCPDSDMLIDYVNGVLDPEEAKRIEGHIGVCGTCTTEFERLKRLVAMTAIVETDDPGDRFNAEVWNRINRTSRGRRTRLVLIPLAAAALALLFFLPGDSSDTTEDQAIVERLDLYQNLDVIDNMEMLMKLATILDSEDGSDL